MPGPFRSHPSGERKALPAAPNVERRVLDDVEKYRRQQFETLGFGDERAYTMAVLRDDMRQGYAFDLGRVRDLIGRGWPPDAVWNVLL